MLTGSELIELILFPTVVISDFWCRLLLLALFDLPIHERPLPLPSSLSHPVSNTLGYII